MLPLFSLLAVVAFCFPGALIDFPLAQLRLQDIYKNYTDDLVYAGSLLPRPIPLLDRPIQPPGYFLLYRNVHKVN